MSSRLPKIRLVHTYAMHRTVYFGWICSLMIDWHEVGFFFNAEICTKWQMSVASNWPSDTSIVNFYLSPSEASESASLSNRVLLFSHSQLAKSTLSIIMASIPYAWTAYEAELRKRWPRSLLFHLRAKFTLHLFLSRFSMSQDGHFRINWLL